jgi:hypothetical protein
VIHEGVYSPSQDLPAHHSPAELGDTRDCCVPTVKIRASTNVVRDGYSFIRHADDCRELLARKVVCELGLRNLQDEHDEISSAAC